MTPTAALLGDVDIWVMLPAMFDKAPDAAAAAMRKGDQVWSYNALSHDDDSPKWLIDYAPANFRIQPGFLSQSLGLTGILYWRADYRPGTEWDAVNNFGKFGVYNAPGEGMLLYSCGAVGNEAVAPSMAEVLALAGGLRPVAVLRDFAGALHGDSSVTSPSPSGD